MSTDTRTLQLLLQPVEMNEKNLIDSVIADYDRMKTARSKWEAEREELMNFEYATDTRTTTNSKLPFKNSTTINKISQIKNNLTTAIMEHLLPNKDWVQWSATDEDSDTKEKRAVIENYVRNKVEESDTEAVIERLVNDYVESGLVVAFTRYVNKTQKSVGGIQNNIYTGTEVVRVDPLDFVYDVTASSLANARKCIRSVFTMGELKKRIGTDAEALLTEEEFQRIRTDRMQLRSNLASSTGKFKYSSLNKAGFGDRINYIENNTVEVLHYYGDFYDFETDELLENYEIVVIDRRIVTRKEPVDNWVGKKNLHVSVYEFREDSLAPIGPLARIVGMQYKLDKLENLKADIYDKFADPATVEVGDVRFHGEVGAPGSRWEVEENGSVSYLLPPAEVLSFETQIPFIMDMMEELTGAPKEAIGQRTPGEKTKFEVQLLDQGQNKLFRRKVKKFERELLTPILEDFLVQGRKNMDQADIVRVMDSELQVQTFTTITADDLQGSGRLQAKGATIFAEKANALQNINTIMNGAIGQQLQPHISKKKLAAAVEQLADLGQFEIFLPNIGVQEAGETERLAAKSTDATLASNATEANVTDETANIPLGGELPQ